VSAVLIFLLIIVCVPVGLMLCTVVARDLDARGLDGRVYGAITFFFFPLGLAVWFYKRSTNARVDADT
jgi:hypothetical protein